MKQMMTLIRGARASFPDRSVRALHHRARMLAAGIRQRKALASLMGQAASGSARRLLDERPEMLGALLWPYQNATWNAEARLTRIAAHCREIDSIGAPFPFSIEERLVLADLSDRHPDTRLVLDQPRWFMREGGLTLNIFTGSFRAYSLAFSLYRLPGGGRGIYIGGLQGRRNDEALDLYRDLTRAFHGMRPRDFLLESLRMLARPWDVREILAVSDAARHHRHPFFGKDTAPKQDYDSIWQDRDGLPEGDDSYRLPAYPERRGLDSIKPNKRSLYRQRYAFLDALEAEIAAGLPGLTPVRFIDT